MEWQSKYSVDDLEIYQWLKPTHVDISYFSVYVNAVFSP